MVTDFGHQSLSRGLLFFRGARVFQAKFEAPSEPGYATFFRQLGVG
jgi:hypothetical protein